MQIELWRRMSPISKVQAVSALTRSVLQLSLAGIRQRFPQATDLECKLRLARLTGPLGSSAGNGQVRLAEVDGGCEVTYDYGLTISGKVAAVGGRMLDGAARVLIGQFFEGLVAELGGGAVKLSWLRRILRALGFGS